VYLDGSTAVPVAERAEDILALLGDRSTLARQSAFHIEEAIEKGEVGDYRRRAGRSSSTNRRSSPATTSTTATTTLAPSSWSPRTAPATSSAGSGWAPWTTARISAGGPAAVWSSRPARAARTESARPWCGAACARAEAEGVLRFDATVQPRNQVLFRRLGWQTVRVVSVADTPHVLMRWPIGRIAALAAATKAPLGPLLGSLPPGPRGYVGDDGAPVPGTDVIAACDAIVPSMVERDPEWAGWCSVLVNVNDLAAMGASPVGLLDAVGAKDAAHARGSSRDSDARRGRTAYRSSAATPNSAYPPPCP